MSRRLRFSFYLVLTIALSPSLVLAWGKNANRLVVNRAVETLPQEIRPFFDANRSILLLHVNDPFGTPDKLLTPAEKRNQVLFLDKYGRFPFEQLPRSYKAALDKFGQPQIQSNRLLPWQIGVYSAKLPDALRDGKW